MGIIDNAMAGIIKFEPIENLFISTYSFDIAVLFKKRLILLLIIIQEYHIQ